MIAQGLQTALNSTRFARDLQNTIEPFSCAITIVEGLVVRRAYRKQIDFAIFGSIEHPEMNS